MKDLSIIVPVYNEAASIQPFISRIKFVLKKLHITHEIIFCLDPSPDNTDKVIQEQIQNNPDLEIKVIILSRRFGQHSATLAGISICDGNSCVVMDIDLQDPPELIEPMYYKLKDGYDVVYAKRRSRKGELLTRRLMSYLFYWFLANLSEIPIPRNTGDFRIISRRVINELVCLKEKQFFLKGLVAYIGFKQTYIEFDREERYLGKTKYNKLFGSLRVAIRVITGFSNRPLELMSITGFCLACFSFCLGLLYIAEKILNPNLTPGLSSTILVICFFSGVQLLSLGLVGEYVARIYDETRDRPRYIIDKIITNQNKSVE